MEISPNRDRKVVTFCLPQQQPVVPKSRIGRRRRSRAPMADKLIQTFYGPEITMDLISAAAELFSENYGVWGPGCSIMGPFAKQGNRVRMSANRLQQQCVPEGAETIYVRILVGDVLAANVFASKWRYGEQLVCWVTQLVVSRDHRECGLASLLLAELRMENADIYGIVTSHPGAIRAAARGFGDGIMHVDFDFIKNHAGLILASSPVDYIKTAKPIGSLFKEPSDTVCSVDSGFPVDHTEPLDALKLTRDEGINWGFGDLLDGQEFLYIVLAKKRTGSRSRSTTPKSPMSPAQ